MGLPMMETSFNKLVAGVDLGGTAANYTFPQGGRFLV
jgi:hypothetical protein